MQHTEDDDQTEISKSQRKRDMDELKRLGMELLEFSDDALASCRCRKHCLKPFEQANALPQIMPANDRCNTSENC